MATELDYRTDDEADERLNPASGARDLYRQENDAANTPEGSNGGTEGSGNTKNIDATRDKEKSSDAPWKANVSSGGGSGAKQPTTFLAQAKKKGPLGLIIGLLGGGGILGAGIAGPAALVIHFKEVVVNKFDSIIGAETERSDLILKGRMFSTNATCAIKIRCRFSGLNELQMSRLRASGADLVDANGKSVEKNVLGRYTGGKTLVLKDGTKVTASDYLKTMGANKDLRDLSSVVFAPRWSSWNGGSSTDVRTEDKLITDPEWGNGDEKQAREDVYNAVSNGETYTAESQAPTSADQYTTDKNGNPVPKQANQTNLDLGDSTAAVNSMASELQQEASSGNVIPSIPTDPGGAAAMAETPLSSPSGLKKIVGFLNPADFLVGLCGTYKLTNTILIAARTIEVINAMRYASQFLSTADKIKAGDGTSNEAAQAATILESQDQYGDAFGDSPTYQYATYGTVPDKSLGASLLGNGVIEVFARIIHWINSTIGKQTVKDGCNIISNPFVQGALSLTSFIPGGGAIADGLKTVFTASAKAIAENTIKDLVQSILKAAAQKISSAVTKDALKNAAKVATKEFLKMAGTAGGIFLAGYLTERYAVPYLARVIAGALIPQDGATAADTVGFGFDSTNQATAQEQGLQPLTPSQQQNYQALNDSTTATYVADQQSQSNPFDLNNPYSAGNALASTFYSFISNVKSSSLLAAPATILSSLNLGSLFSGSNALADSANPNPDCQQDDFTASTGLATTLYCNPAMGFNDINMLQNTDPDTGVTQWMLNNNEIDSTGNPINGSDYADWIAKCPVSTKQITDVGDESNQLDPECYDVNKNNTTEYKMFHLYTIDLHITTDMDNDPGSTAATTSMVPNSSQPVATTSPTDTVPTTTKNSTQHTAKSNSTILSDLGFALSNILTDYQPFMSYARGAF